MGLRYGFLQPNRPYEEENIQTKGLDSFKKARKKLCVSLRTGCAHWFIEQIL